MSRTTQNRRKKLSRKKARRRHRLMNSEFARVFADRVHQAMMFVMKASPYEYCLFQTPNDGMTKSPTMQNPSHDAIVKDGTPNSRK